MTRLLTDKIKHGLSIQRRVLFAALYFISINQLSHAAIQLPSANRECASCHIMWLTEFKREDVSTLIPYDPKPVMNTGAQDVSSTDPMCFSCHDGFVLESRYLWKEGKYAHPVGVKPSDKIKIPVVEGKNLFPLNDDGKVYCGTCHTAHGVDWNQKDTAIFMRVRNDSGQLCTSCHEEKTKGPEHGGHPIKVKIKELTQSPPTKLIQAGGQFEADGGVTCQSCHRPHAAPDKKLLVMENTRSELCSECHSDRYAFNREQAGHMGTHPVNVLSDKIKIPEELIAKGAKTGAAGEVICQSCHKPHDAVKKSHLLVSENDKDSLCQTCHIEQRKVANTKHDMRLLRPDSLNKKNNLAEKSGPCSACHLPHEGTGPKMWARNIATDVEPMDALCLSCHQTKGLAEKHTVGEYSHAIGVDISRLKQPVDLPAFSKGGVKTVKQMQGKVGCASCHDAHQWNPAHADDKGDVNKEGNNKTRFLRVANGAEAGLCKTCHQEKWDVANSKHDMRYMAPASTNALGQTVAESGICGSCHLVHNAKGPKLWARTDLQGQGTGYIACTGCHNKNGLAKDKIIGDHTHPMDVPVDHLSIQSTADGWVSTLLKQKSDAHKDEPVALQALPLYDNRGRPVNQDGRVGCGTCHDPHRWSTLPYAKTDQPAKLEGDADSSFLRIADLGKNQLCNNCHVDKQSVMFTKHDLSNASSEFSPLPAGKVDNVKGGSVKGACLHCHMPHNAKGPALWARNQGEGPSPIARLCADCHQKKAVAGKKSIEGHNHPVGVSTAKLATDPLIPVFDQAGDRAETGGNIDCASCHNPHQWTPGNPAIRNTDLPANAGDASNSFLRLPADHQSKLCVSCHADKKMIQGTDHDLSVTAPSSKNKLQQSRDASGLCGQCHIPHNAETESSIWARALGKGVDEIEKKCRSCHQSDQLAAVKNPVLSKHPDSIMLWSPELRKQIKQQPVADLPVFDKQGKRTNFGELTCSSCHDPHQWSTDHKISGAGKNMEGDVMSSFLRTDQSPGAVCSDCHGKDGIFRYKYFHGESAHTKHHMFK